ncbi:MAG: iron-sulfur cluster repair di-iron protein [Acidobacteriota bacterium]
MTLNQTQTTREIAIQHPEAVPVFESLGIDYCCGGTRTLGEACERADVDWDHLVELLNAVDAPPERARTDWAARRLDALTGHIVDTHHAYVRESTPRIHHWLEKVVAKHGAAHPELRDIQGLFGALSEELAAHMLKEERILFPALDRLAQGRWQGNMAGNIEAPIQKMMAEHDDAGEALAKIRALTGNYQPPTNACPTYRALYHGLAEFERDLHQHVHLENNILFPAALDLERQPSGA